MFSMKKSELTGSDQLINQIRDLLFPPFETRDIEGERFAVDSSVDTNVEAVLTDLRDGYMDEMCLNTLQAIFDKLYKVRELLKAFHEMDPAIKKYIIAMQPISSVADRVEAAQDEPDL